jgi:aspartate racemase
MGRLDDQIKIGGYRVEPVEVEAALLRHSGVREAVVVARPTREGENQLVAYVVAGPQGLTVSELRTHLEQSLPAHMIPSIFVGLERLPRRPNGKLDRNALPSQALNRLESGQPFVAPRTELEETLARTWCDVLGHTRVSVHDSFFNLGGTSLLAGRLVSRIQTTCGRHLSLATLFLHPTVARLAEILEMGESARSHRSIVEVRRGGPKPPLFFPPTMVGGAFICDAILAQLPPDQPVYAYATDVHSTEESGAQTMEAMALRCCEELSAFQPDGPVCLAGYSFGGLLAYEMARHLCAQGRPVKLLAIIDIGPGRITPRGPGGALRASRLFLRNLPRWIFHLLFHTTADEVRVRTRARLINLFKNVSMGFSRIYRSLFPVITYNIVTMNDRQVDVRSRMTDYLRALAERRHPPYTGRAVLFRARTRPLLHSHAPDLGWSELVLGGLEIVHLSGNHGTIIQEPHVHELARKFRAALDAALEGQRTIGE